MAHQDEKNGHRAAAKFRVRFSLFALLVLMTLVCLALAWWVQPRRVVATALFYVTRITPTILDDDAAQQRDEQDFEIVKKTQLALLKSHYVLQAALRNPTIAALPIFQGKPDPVVWLQENLAAEFPHDAEILAIRLRGPEEFAGDLVQVVDAVAKAYEDEVVFENHQRTLGTRDLKAATTKKLADEISRKMQELQDLRAEAGEDFDNSVDGRMRQMELDVLTEQWRDLIRSLERDDIEAAAPRRIRKIQPAVISPE